MQSNSALSAAQSSLECGKYIVAAITLDQTGHNYVTDAEPDNVWIELYQHVWGTALDGQAVLPPTRFTDSIGSGD